MAFPPGHMPGIHIPGTLVPIGAAAQEAAVRRRHVAFLLLLGAGSGSGTPIDSPDDANAQGAN
jgi:hypothetical protein